MDLNHLIISITVKIFYPFNICSYESLKESQRTKTHFCVYQLKVDCIKNCCVCLSNGAGGGIRTPEPYGPAYKAGAFDHSATPAN